MVPPVRVEQSVVSALRHQGRLATPRRRRRAPALAAAVAAAVVGFSAGVLTHRVRESIAPASPQFVLLLYAGDPSPAPDRHAEYAAWARAASIHGASVSGNELDPAAEEIGGPSTTAAQRPDQLRGYFVIRAADLEEARTIAATCPHVKSRRPCRAAAGCRRSAAAGAVAERGNHREESRPPRCRASAETFGFGGAPTQPCRCDISIVPAQTFTLPDPALEMCRLAG